MCPRHGYLLKATLNLHLASWGGVSSKITSDMTIPLLMAEREEELKSLLMKEKEERKKVGLKLNIQKSKIMASGPITSLQIDGETVETVTDFF